MTQAGLHMSLLVHLSDGKSDPADADADATSKAAVQKEYAEE